MTKYDLSLETRAGAVGTATLAYSFFGPQPIASRTAYRVTKLRNLNVYLSVKKYQKVEYR